MLETLGKYGRNQPAQSLNTSGIAGTSIKLDTLNLVVVKGESKYCQCQQCERRIIFKCKKCNISLHPEYMKPYHQLMSTCSLYAILYLYKPHCDKIDISTLRIKHIFIDPCFLWNFQILTLLTATANLSCHPNSWPIKSFFWIFKIFYEI